MGELRLFLLLALVLFLGVHGGYRPQNRKWILRGRPWHGLRAPRTDTPLEGDTTVTESYFTQELDHFNSSKNFQWKQRYWYNPTYYNQDNGINFLMIGGEGPEYSGEVTATDTPFGTWGRQLNAGLWCLEHRFYGKSRPFSTQTTGNLQYLHSRQALADLANFIESMNKAHNITNPKWVVFGGSYPGALALWFRELYPHLTVGAVGSSGPVQAQMDFYQYLQVCEASIRSYSTVCADEIEKGFQQMVTLMNTKSGRDKLTSTFTLKPGLNDLPLSYNDIQNFYSTVFGNFQGAVQYNRVAGRYLKAGSIPDVCKFMEVQNRSPVQKLSDVNEYITEFSTGAKFNYTPNSFNDEIESLRDVTYDETGEAAATRSWIWQTCNEFGFFQTTDIGKNIFGSVYPVNIDIILCEKVFGPQFNVDYIKLAVNKTLKAYGGRDNYNATNVVIPNGSLDPWHALGTYKSTDVSVVPFLITGTAHCADMEPTSTNDPPGLAVVRKLIFENIQKWVGKYVISKENDPFATTQVPITKPKNPTAATVEHKYNATDKKEQKEMRLQVSSSSRRIRMGHSMGGFLAAPPAHDDLDTQDLWLGTILQDVDHFDLQNPNQFEQRYWYNTRWYKPGGPIFLMIGGEGPAGADWVTNPNITYLTWAQKYNAAVYQLEHRYYGKSRPTADQSTENLKWLTSEQMLADLAVFIQTMNQQRGYVNPKWITFGGSYSGALSAWMRETYPELVAGAVASSAPVFAKVDFFEYLQVVEKAITEYSQQCAYAIQSGFRILQKNLMTAVGRQILSDRFQLSPPWDENSILTERDAQYFFQNVVSAFQGAVQYSGDNMGLYATGYGIKQACALMLDNDYTPTENLARVVSFMNGVVGLDNNFEGMVNALKNVSFDYGGASGRSWIWQSCNEFGFFQTTDNGESLFGSPVPVNFWINLCTDVYGPAIDRTYIDNGVKRTLQYYGGRDNYRGTNVVLPNGSNDPWHALGKLTSTDSSVVPYLINGTAHCADMYPARPEDKPGLAVVRKLIAENLEKWINFANSFTTSSYTATPHHGSTTSSANSGSPSVPSATTQPVPTTTKSATAAIASSLLLLVSALLV
uniref:Serine protease K12H4.7 n=1 Tax=Steinernema glaseri TaxID=37863 RepID=A0A1I8ALQ5_9BILA